MRTWPVRPRFWNRTHFPHTSMFCGACNHRRTRRGVHRGRFLNSSNAEKCCSTLKIISAPDILPSTAPLFFVLFLPVAQHWLGCEYCCQRHRNCACSLNSSPIECCFRTLKNDEKSSESTCVLINSIIFLMYDHLQGFSVAKTVVYFVWENCSTFMLGCVLGIHLALSLFTGVKRNFWPWRNFWPIIVCQLFCFAEQRNKVWRLLVWCVLCELKLFG